MPVLTLAPNRLVSGSTVELGRVWDPAATLALFTGLALFGAAFVPQSRRNSLIVALVAVILTTSLVWFAGAAAVALADPNTPAARVSLGGAFWALLAAGWLALADALQRAGLSRPARILCGGAGLVPAAALLASGRLDHLSIMVEYANRRDVFSAAVVRHCEIVLLTLVPTLLIGVPLGILARRSHRLRDPLFAILNVIQTIPSIALFAMLLGPLAAVAAGIPLLARRGLGGIGIAPAIIALTLYSLLPIARNTEAGLAQVPSAVIDAARGMGLRPRQIFWQVEVPLALPLFLSGLRVTLVQAIGLTAVAALIGAGGLGAIMFQGLSGSAIDLVLLGVLPIIALTLAADALLKLAISWVAVARA